MGAIVLNLYGGPSTGKSTTAAGVFCRLKQLGVNCELSREYAKDLVWERSYDVLANQIFVFGVQHQRLFSLLRNVDVVITDAPLLHSLIYDQTGNEHFRQMVIEEHRKLNNIDVFLKRTKPFRQEGRYHDEAQSLKIDQQIQELLDQYTTYGAIPADDLVVDQITHIVLTKLKG